MTDYGHPTDLDFSDCEFPRCAPKEGRIPLIRTPYIYQTERDEDISGYSERILGIVAGCANAGIPEGHNAESAVGVSKHGERFIQLFCVVDEATQTFSHVGFKCRGEIATIACASRIAFMIEGKTFAEALAISAKDLRDDLGAMLPDRANRAYIAVEAVRAAIGDYYLRRGATLADLDRVVPCDEYSVGCILCEHCSLRDMRVRLRFA